MKDHNRLAHSNLALKNLMESLLAPGQTNTDNLKLEELAGNRQKRDSRW
jgi:hypothetical protein